MLSVEHQIAQTASCISAKATLSCNYCKGWYKTVKQWLTLATRKSQKYNSLLAYRNTREITCTISSVTQVIYCVCAWNPVHVFFMPRRYLLMLIYLALQGNHHTALKWLTLTWLTFVSLCTSVSVHDKIQSILTLSFYHIVLQQPCLCNHTSKAAMNVDVVC